MRLDINLASHPYEDARQFWMVWGTAVGVAGLLTLVLLGLDASGWIYARRDRKEMQQARAMIAQCDRNRAEAEAFLNRPENRTTRDKSEFLNELIEHKAFSWTLVLENLEKVMPPRVHLVAISPGLTDDNQVSLKMTVAGDSRDRAIELAKRMEESRRFAQTNVQSEATIQSQTGDTEVVEIGAIYVPEAPADAQATNAKNAGGKKSESKDTAQDKSQAKPAAKAGTGSAGKPNVKVQPNLQKTAAGRRED